MATNSVELIVDAAIHKDRNAVNEDCLKKETVVKEGWLKKKHHSLFRVGSDGRRYCKLIAGRGGCGTIELYLDPSDTSPLVTMGLEGAWIDVLEGDRPSIKLNLGRAAGRRNAPPAISSLRSPLRGKHVHYVLHFVDELQMSEWASAFSVGATDEIILGRRHFFVLNRSKPSTRAIN